MTTNKAQKTNTSQLVTTSDYGKFEMHNYNRPIHRNDPLLASMKRVGFMPSSPIQCVKTADGKLKIIRGHHRYSVAKSLGIPVVYVIDNSNVDIFELEGASTSAWNAPDFAFARAQAGDGEIKKMLEFKDAHGLTLGAASSMLAGQSAGSGNTLKTIKRGAFKVRDTDHALEVVAITDAIRADGAKFAASSAFVAALSMAIRTPDVDYNKLRHSVVTRWGLIARKTTASEYLKEIEAVYNYATKGRRFPLEFNAKEAARARSIANNNKRAE